MIRSVARRVHFELGDAKEDEPPLRAPSESGVTLTGPRRVEAQTPPVALPNHPCSLQDLIDSDELISEFMNEKCIPPTEAEILQAQEKGNFFTLCDLLDNLVAMEWKAQKFTLKLRDLIRDAFAEVHKIWKRKGVRPEELLPENPTREQKDKIQRLKLFVEEGRGADTVIIYAKIPLPIHPLAKNYHEKLRSFLDQKWYFSAEETLPGMKKTLAQLMGSSSAEYRLPLKESVIIPERIERIDQHIKQMVPEAEILNSVLCKSTFLDGFVGERTPCDLFIRGSDDTVKSRFIQHFLKIPPKLLFSPETIRDQKDFGSFPMSQHESSFALNRLNIWIEKNIQRRFHNQPNVSQEANETIGRIAEKKRCVVLDLVKPRTEDEASKNRFSLIQLALKNPKIYYIFYLVNEYFIPIFVIDSGKLIKFREEIFLRVCKENNLNL